MDQAGVLKDTANFVNMTQATISFESLGVFLHYGVFDGPGYYGATVIGNGYWFCHFGYAVIPGSSWGSMLSLVEGDTIGIAVDIDSRVAWFRLNGGHWNNDQYGNTVSLNQDPVTASAASRFPTPGRWGPR